MKEKEKRNKKKRRLLLLLLLLCVTGSLLGVSSYAWFTANETVTINKITVNVAAKNGIQISTDGTNWKSIIQTTDITSAHTHYLPETQALSVNQLPDTLEPVSTGKEVGEDGRLKMFYGVTDTNAAGDYILTATQTTEQRTTDSNVGKFITFDIYLKVDKTGDLYMTKTSNVTAQGDDKGIKNASRIGFIVLGNVPNGTELKNIQGIKGDATSPIYIWEPNYDVHSATGITNAADVYGITTTAANADRIEYEGVKAEIQTDNDVLLKEASSKFKACLNGGVRDKDKTTEEACTGAGGTWTAINETYFTPVTVDYSTVQNFDTSVPVFNGLTQGITKIRVYMWVEGQDVDCENGASGGNINYDLQFSINA